jgi:hypothetical protein
VLWSLVSCRSDVPVTHRKPKHNSSWSSKVLLRTCLSYGVSYHVMSMWWCQAISKYNTQRLTTWWILPNPLYPNEHKQLSEQGAAYYESLTPLMNPTEYHHIVSNVHQTMPLWICTWGAGKPWACGIWRNNSFSLRYNAIEHSLWQISVHNPWPKVHSLPELEASHPRLLTSSFHPCLAWPCVSCTCESSLASISQWVAFCPSTCSTLMEFLLLLPTTTGIVPDFLLTHISTCSLSVRHL